MTEPCELSAAEAAAELAGGRLTSEELVRSCLARIAARDATVRAWSFVDPDMALRAARELDKQPRRSALHGIPVGIKDMIDTRDQPTQHNSPLYPGHRPGHDAACVAILRAAGAVILGKTDTHEFAAGGRLPATRNPRNPAHTPGGSSSGSAAAVADGHAPLALGTQTAGSTIRPASFCGIYAMKPTHGIVSREGAKPYAYSLDTLGWFGRSVPDLALLAKVFAVGETAPASPRPRIGLCRTPYWSAADASSRETVESAAEALRAAGLTVEDVVLDDRFSAMNDWQNTIMRAEGRAAFLAEYRSAPHLLHQDFRNRVEDADGLWPDRLREALDAVSILRPVFDALARPFDGILTPAVMGEAPLGLHSTGNPMFNRMWTALHVPCVALPAGHGPHGLPVGVQLVGPRYDEPRLLATATEVDRILRSRRQ